MRRRLGARGLAAALGMAGAAPLTAQGTLDVEVAWAARQELRGALVVSRPTIATSVDAGWTLGAVRLAAGTWWLVEPLGPRPSDLTLRGGGASLVELDAWAQGTRRWLGHDVTLGVARYAFPSERAPRFALPTPADAYAMVERSTDVPITERWWYRARLWQGLGARGARGARYADVSLGPQWLLAPLRDVSLALTGTSGVRLTRAEAAPRGVSHFELAASLASVARCDELARGSRWHRLLDAALPKQASVRTRFGRDSLTRLVRRDAQRPRVSWLEVAWSPTRCAASR